MRQRFQSTRFIGRRNAEFRKRRRGPGNGCRYREAAGRRDRPGDDCRLDPRRDHRLVGPEGRYVRAVGVADKATGAPMKALFYSRIGSLTKTFTVTGMLQLSEQGKLGLDDPIANYIDGVPQRDKITLRQLARMRSGLENYANSTEFQQALIADPYRNFTPQELLG